MWCLLWEGGGAKGAGVCWLTVVILELSVLCPNVVVSTMDRESMEDVGSLLSIGGSLANVVFSHCFVAVFDESKLQICRVRAQLTLNCIYIPRGRETGWLKVFVFNCVIFLCEGFINLMWCLLWEEGGARGFQGSHNLITLSLDQVKKMHAVPLTSHISFFSFIFRSFWRIGEWEEVGLAR